MAGESQLAGLILYSFVLVIAFVLLFYIVNQKYFEWKSPHTVFLILLLAFLTCRIFWFSLNYENAIFPSSPSSSSKTWSIKDSTYTLTRIAFCFYFATLSAVLYKWILMVEIVESTSHAKLPDADWILTLVYVVNFLFSLSIFINIIVYAAGEKGREGSLTYDTGILIIANFNLVVLVAFVVWGIRLYFVTSKTINQKLITVIVLSSIFFICFVMRVILLLYRPITGNFLPEVTFNVLCYFIPELLPMCSQMSIVMRVTSLKRQKTLDDYARINEKEKTSLLRSKEEHSEPSEHSDHSEP